MSTFTLDADGAQSAGQGIGSLFKAFALGPQMRQQAEMETMGGMAKINQAQASARYANSRAALDDRQLANQKDPLESAMLRHGLPTALAPAFRSKLVNGSFGPSYEAPVDGIGPTQQAPADSDTVAKLGRSMELIQRMYGSGSNVSMMGDAELKAQQVQQIDAVQANPELAGAVGTSQAAGLGKTLFSDIGNSGQSRQNFTGEAGPVNAVIAKLYQQIEQSKANQHNAAAGASAANSYSSAGLHNAQRDRVINGLDKPVTIVDEDTGQATVTTLPTRGAPVSIGVAAKKGGGVDATNAKARNALLTAVEKEMTGAPDAEVMAEFDKRWARRQPNKSPSNTLPAPRINAQESGALDKARAAIAGGAPRDKVIERLKQNGINPAGL